MRTLEIKQVFCKERKVGKKEICNKDENQNMLDYGMSGESVRSLDL